MGNIVVFVSDCSESNLVDVSLLGLTLVIIIETLVVIYVLCACWETMNNVEQTESRNGLSQLLVYVTGYEASSNRTLSIKDKA